MFNLKLSDGSTVPLPDTDGVFSNLRGYLKRQDQGVADLLEGGEVSNPTAEHYTKQWGPGLSFQQFIKGNPEALLHMPSGQLGWPALLARIRSEAEERRTLVYDAACGYGGVFSQLFFAPIPRRLHYLGADIHNSLSTIERPSDLPLSAARFVRWDISRPLPLVEQFDYVICRNALMHTPDPRVTLISLVDRLEPGGTIAISVYARKPLLRELLDDALRKRIVGLPPAEALGLANQFTLLGRDLRNSHGKIVIQQDLPFMGIQAGEYEIQTFIYDHIVKCWFNDLFGERYSDVVNFDWYHPPYAYRYTHEEVQSLFSGLSLKITKTTSSTAQHYVEATKEA